MVDIADSIVLIKLPFIGQEYTRTKHITVSDNLSSTSSYIKSVWSLLKACYVRKRTSALFFKYSFVGKFEPRDFYKKNSYIQKVKTK